MFHQYTHQSHKTNATMQEKISNADKNFLKAVLQRDPVECKKWLEQGANINVKFGSFSEDSRPKICEPTDTPLTRAAGGKNSDFMKFLLENGADTEVSNCGKTPLMTAAFGQNIAIVKLLLKFGANVNAKNNGDRLYTTGKTAMHYLFFSVREWKLDLDKTRCLPIAILLIHKGFSGNAGLIVTALAKSGIHPSIRNFFTEIWKEANKAGDNPYTRGAIVGALAGTELPVETRVHIGTFLGRKEGAFLARTCNAAAQLARAEVEAEFEPRMQ